MRQWTPVHKAVSLRCGGQNLHSNTLYLLGDCVTVKRGMWVAIGKQHIIRGQSMKAAFALVICLFWASLLPAQTSNNKSTINFNLVQVNHYKGQEEATSGIESPGPRVVVDPNNPQALHQLRAMETQIPKELITPLMQLDISLRSSSSAEIPWEKSAVIYSPSGADSFLVTSSRRGCPGTEVRPSVSVAFPTRSGWSFPPIRFGPLTESTICALGSGQKLEVCAVGDLPPRVRLTSK